MNYKLGRFERPNPVSTLETHMWRKLDIKNIEDTPKVEIKSAELPEEHRRRTIPHDHQQPIAP